MKGREFLFKESMIELEDDIIGIIDEPVNVYLLEWEKGNEFLKKPDTDVVNKDHTEILLYWNFVL